MIPFLITYIFYFFSLYYLGYSLLQSKIHNKYLLFAISELFAICTSLFSTYPVTTKNITLFMVCSFLFLFIFFSNSFKRKVLIFFVYIFIILISEILVNFVVTLIANFDYLENNQTYVYILVSILTSLCSIFIVCYITHMTKEMKQIKVPKNDYIILMLPISTLLIIRSVSSYKDLIVNNKVFIMAIVLLLCSNFITFYIFMKSMKVTRDFNDLKSKKEVIDFEYQHLNRLYSSNFMFMHDVIRKFMKLQKDMDGNNFTSFKNDLIDINSHMIKNFNILNSSVGVIDSVMTYFLNDFLDQGIEFQNTMQYKDFSFIKLNDQKYIFYTVLLIAYHSTMHSETNKKVILLKSKEIASNIFISIVFNNSCYLKSEEYKYNYLFLNNILVKYNTHISLEYDSDNSFVSLLIKFEKFQ